MSTSTCPPPTETPNLVNLPIPRGVNVVVMTGSHASNPEMAVCCKPNAVQLVNDCFLWCELPKSYLNGTSPEQGVDSFHTCLRINGGNDTVNRSIGWRLASGGEAVKGLSITQLGIWTLLTMAFVAGMQ